MLDLAKFKQNLVDSGALDAAQLERAQKHAFETNISLSEALLTLNILSYRGLGKCFAELYDLPYVNILASPPPEEARRAISTRFAVRWKAFPVSCSPSDRILTLAVYDPDQISRIEKTFRFFLLPQALGFVIASKAEVDKAFETYYGVVRPQSIRDAEDKVRSSEKKMKLSGLRKTPAETPGKPPTPGTPPDKQVAAEAAPIPPAVLSATPPAPERQGLKPAAGPADKDKPAGAADTSKLTGSALRRALTVRPASEALGAASPGPKPWSRYNRSLSGSSSQDIPYTDMSRALLNAIATLVRTQLAEDPLRTMQTRARVRYCQLLAGRMGITPVQTDATVLAAWLSMIQDKPDIVGQLPTPYRLDELLAANEDTVKTSSRPEAQILGLVKAFQDLKQKDPLATKDVNLTRRGLRLAWSSATENQNVLELFLQLLMDEEFLSQLDKKTGSILVVDPNEIAAATMAPPLINDGYDVAVVTDGLAAEARLESYTPDLVLAAADPARQTVSHLCQKIRKTPKTATVPIVVLIEKKDEKHSAEYLRAGADEVLTKPIDLEVLFLRINRLMTPKGEGDPEAAGVKGSLSDMSFTDMIQILCAGGKSMEISLTRGEMTGSVHVQNGNIVHATLGDKEGDAAFYELMRWTSGDFLTRHCADFPRRTIQTSLMSLLMEGSRIQDELGTA